MPTLYQSASSIFGETLLLTTSTLLIAAFAVLLLAKTLHAARLPRRRRAPALTRGIPS
jgi:hypothetical protein